MNSKDRVMEEWRQDIAMIPEYQEPPVAGAAHGSEDAELWGEFMRSVGLKIYNTDCQCGCCRLARMYFPFWKSKRATPQPPNEKLSHSARRKDQNHE